MSSKGPPRQDRHAWRAVGARRPRRLVAQRVEGVEDFLGGNVGVLGLMGVFCRGLGFQGLGLRVFFLYNWGLGVDIWDKLSSELHIIQPYRHTLLARPWGHFSQLLVLRGSHLGTLFRWFYGPS